MVNIKNPKTNQVKQVKAGFSWTVFFFGFFPPLFRGDWKWLLILLVLDIVGLFSFGFLSFAANLVFSFLYNKFYLQDRINEGWIPCDEASKSIMLSRGIVFPVND
jgi:hypothetical protein